MGLRADQVAMTRRRIMETVVELSADTDAGTVTVAEVSRRSGVAPATIYRHFPTRDDLVSAAAHARMLVGVAPGSEGFGPHELRAHLLVLWNDLAANLALTRQATLSGAGRELRQARFDVLAPAYRAALATAGIDPDSDDGRRVLACTHLLQSAYGLLDLHDRQGFSVEESVDAVAWGIEALLRTIGLQPSDFRVPISRPVNGLSEERP
jgi:AcrR family transcriptional regulator